MRELIHVTYHITDSYLYAHQALREAATWLKKHPNLVAISVDLKLDDEAEYYVEVAVETL